MRKKTQNWEHLEAKRHKNYCSSYESHFSLFKWTVFMFVGRWRFIFHTCVYRLTHWNWLASFGEWNLFQIQTCKANMPSDHSNMFIKSNLKIADAERKKMVKFARAKITRIFEERQGQINFLSNLTAFVFGFFVCAHAFAHEHQSIVGACCSYVCVCVCVWIEKWNLFAFSHIKFGFTLTDQIRRRSNMTNWNLVFCLILPFPC